MAETYVSRSAIAGRLGLTERRITQLVKDGALADGTPFPSRVQGRERTFPSDRCFDWYVQFKQEEALQRAQPGDPTTLVDAERRKAVAAAEMGELKVARARAELVPAALFRDELRAVLTRVATRLRSTPGEFGERFVGIVDKPAAITQLQRLVDTVLAEMQHLGEADEDVAA